MQYRFHLELHLTSGRKKPQQLVNSQKNNVHRNGAVIKIELRVRKWEKKSEREKDQKRTSEKQTANNYP